MHLQAALADTSIPTVEVQSAEDPNDEPELEVLDDNAIKLDTSNVPIILTISQVLPKGILHSVLVWIECVLSSCYPGIDTIAFYLTGTNCMSVFRSEQHWLWT